MKLRRTHARPLAALLVILAALAVVALATAALAIAALPGLAFAESVIPAAPFRKVMLRHGGVVVLRPSKIQRVTLVEGSPALTRVVVEGDQLRIEGCALDCPRGYKSVVEVLTPALDEVLVRDGGILRSEGEFGPLSSLRAGVEDGGVLDLRALTADEVTAAIHSGGNILTRPRKALVARIEQGGAVTYWGSPHVRSSVRQGGVVTRGRAGEESLPLDRLSPGVRTLPRVPAVPRVPGAPREKSSSGPEGIDS